MTQVVLPKTQGVLGILLCCSLLPNPFVWLHFLFLWEIERSGKAQEAFYWLGIGKPHSPSSVCWATGGDESSPLGSSRGSVNSRFLNFTQQFTGREEGKLGNLSSGAALGDENLLGTPLLPSRYGAGKCRFRLPGGDGEGDLGGKSIKAVKRPSGNLRHCLSLVCLVICGQENALRIILIVCQEGQKGKYDLWS